MARRVRKRKSAASILIKLIIMVVIAAFFYRSIIAIGSSLAAVAISSDKLYSTNAILVRLTDSKVLLQKNSEDKIYPASLTKLMTVLVAIENLPDLNEEIRLTRSMFDGLYEANASMAGFQPDEQVRAKDLIYGVMLPSGAECCRALAYHIAGSEPDFVELMNQKAEDLGMANTHFVNASGLHDGNHYTTVRDIAILLNYALRNEDFRNVFTTFRYSTAPTNKHPEGITFYSTLFDKLTEQQIADGAFLGGKTGYTAEAGLCLASLALVDEKEYILVTAGAKGNHNSQQYNVIDAFYVYNCLGSFVHNEADAADIVQEGAYKAIKYSDTLKKIEYAETWVYRIMMNEIYKRMNSKPIKSIDEEDFAESQVEDAYEDIDLIKALNSMPENDKAVIQLKYFEGLSLEEIADVLGENISTVKSRLYRGLKKLRSKMEDSG